MIRNPPFKSYAKDVQGLASTEFVVISFALLMIIFFIVELTLLYFLTQSEQKAAHMGARLAIVSDSAASGLPNVNGLEAGGVFGTSCSFSPAPCTDFGTLTCVGGVTGCNIDAFNRILDRMQNFMPGLLAEHVTISYAYQGLGYAGGPVIPAITLTINGVPHQTGIMGVVLAVAQAVDVIPPVSVTLTGEDLSNSGS